MPNLLTKYSATKPESSRTPLKKNKKIIKKYFSQTLQLTIFLSFFAKVTPTYAWTGYDYNNKTEIEIEAGNLVREGLLIQFYDSKDNNYHSAKIIFMNEIAGGTEIKLKDLDANQERVFLMHD
jgi:hypothetical protein